MVEMPAFRTFRRLEPRIGWLSFVLLLAALTTVLAAAMEVGWVPEDWAIIPAALAGFGLALWLSEKRLSPWIAWLVLSLAGFALVIIILAGLTPPLETLVQGNPAVAIYWEQSMAIFSDRVGSWLQSVATGGRSTETMGFAVGIALAAWFLGALLGWTSDRLGQEALGLGALGVSLALTTYFGQSGVYWVVIFVGLATTSIAIAQYGNLASAWDRNGTDYSGEVRIELLMYAGTVSLLLMTAAYALPAINVRAIAENFRRQPAISEAEDTLARVFAGVAQPRVANEEVATGGTVGVLPRSFLLGSAPELLESVVMIATLSSTLGPADQPPGHHWRATSYDVYTGRGWLRSPEREEDFAANQPIPFADDEAQTTASTAMLTQRVEVANGNLTARYTVGRLVSVNRSSVVYWRGVDDLVRASDSADSVTEYEAVSRVVLPEPEALQQARTADIPAAIMARYTDLPESVPERVGQLARHVVGLESTPSTSPLPLSDNTGPATTPYDQALALESFLQQYPYSLSVGLPPPGVDMADYFLFDLQSGFCDYYATAMVVMARSLGLPARLAIGYLPQPADANNRQVLRQVNAHSWAEIYFAGFGWVEFEPTAPIPGQEAAMASVGPPDYSAYGIPTVSAPVSIPDRAPQDDTPWPLVAVMTLAALGVGGLWLRRWRAVRDRRPLGLDEVQAAFYNLQRQSQRLGYTGTTSQTPDEFTTGLTHRLADMDDDHEVAQELGPQLSRLATLYGRRQYGPATDAAQAADGSEASSLWNAIRPKLVDLASPWRTLRQLGRG